MTRRLVIVESPTKAKTLQRFLGPDFVLQSSVGHIRDLPASAAEIPERHRGEKWARLGVDVENDFQPLYVVNKEKKKVIGELKKRLKEVDELLLATDEDREGEAISWHLAQVLNPKVPMRRMVFHEITKEAITQALDNTREIDEDLVRAQEARRIIDRLYGYEVSPVLWKKIAPKLSAGRVQCVAIRMVVERELARMRFRAAHYRDLIAVFRNGAGKEFGARLLSLDGRRLAGSKDFDPDSGKLKRPELVVLSAEEAAELTARLSSSAFEVESVEEKSFKRTPAPPFTTSTLQQEGGRKLGFNARRTMRAAQNLYERGLITYMRTDSVALSPEAIRATRDAVSSLYGPDYLPAKPRSYRNKVKNAQEAHEAIRPAGESFSTPRDLASALSGDEAKVYELVWKRTMASQMNDARGRRVVVRVASCATAGNVPGASGQAGASLEAGQALFQANGNTIDFPGFLRAYAEGSDDPEAAVADREVILPPLEPGEALEARSMEVAEHETQPPQRLTEASLVKAMEESGVGRPSTYASIIDTIQRREYTFKKGAALVPTFTAFAVVRLMSEHFADLIDQNFTARMEDRLDQISRGELELVPYLREFYFGNSDSGLRPLLDKGVENIDPRTVCSIPMGRDEQGREIVVRVGRYGPFLQRGEDTAPLPDGICPDELTPEAMSVLIEEGSKGPRLLGPDPESGQPVYVKKGRFGPYVQLGDVDPDSKEKPKMASLLPGMKEESLELDTALKLLNLPRLIGEDDAGVEILGYNGRYGPYIKRGSDSRSLEEGDDLLALTRERALELLAQERKFGRQSRAPIKVFENVEALGGVDVRLLKGRYGPYVTDGETNASLPRSIADPESLEEAQAVELILERRAKGPARRKTKKKKAKKTAKKKTAKKAAGRKSDTGNGAGGGAARKTAAVKKTATSKKKTAKKTVKKAASKKSAPSKSTTSKSAGKAAAAPGHPDALSGSGTGSE